MTEPAAAHSSTRVIKFNQSGSSTSSSAMSASFSSDYAGNVTPQIIRARSNISQIYRTPTGPWTRFTPRSKTHFASKAYLNSLVPDHVILKIFWYLNKRDLVHAMQTCRRLKNLGKHDSFWCFLNGYKKIFSEAVLHTLLDRKIRILRLHSATIEIPLFASWWYPLPAANAACLTHLDLSQAKIPTKALENLLNRCFKLRGFSLENADTEFSEKCCLELAKNVELEYLDLIYVRGMTAFGIKKVLTECQMLKEASFAWIKMDDEAFVAICNLAPPSLRRINLSGLINLETVNDTNLSILCMNCPNLEELDLSDNRLITEELIPAILTLKRLKILWVSRCYNIEPETFLQFAQLKLLALNVHSCIDNDGLAYLKGSLYPTEIDAPRFSFSTVSRPTVGGSVSSVWGKRTRDIY